MLELQKISKHGTDEIKIITEKAKNYSQIEAIYLFGSCSRKEDTENSDVDTLIIWNGWNDENIHGQGLEVSKFVEEVFLEKLFKWDRLFLNSKSELNKMNYGVWENIKEINNVIYERSDYNA